MSDYSMAEKVLDLRLLGILSPLRLCVSMVPGCRPDGLPGWMDGWMDEKENRMRLGSGVFCIKMNINGSRLDRVINTVSSIKKLT